MNNQIGVIFKKYILAVIITVLGLGLLIYGLRAESQQSTMFNIAAVNILVAGILAILLSSGVLKRIVVFVIGGVALVVTMALLYTSWNLIAEAEKYRIASERAAIATTQVLTEIRDIQKAYKENNDKYAENWEELENFFVNGKVLEARPMGSVPDRPISKEERKMLYNDNRPLDKNMTEWEATRLARMGAIGVKNARNNFEGDLSSFKRDTVEVPFSKNFLANRRYAKNRKDAALSKFTVDSLRFVPMTGGDSTWYIETILDKVIASDTLSVTRVWGYNPILQNKTIVGFGDLSTGDLKGTWE